MKTRKNKVSKKVLTQIDLAKIYHEVVDIFKKNKNTLEPIHFINGLLTPKGGIEADKLLMPLSLSLRNVDKNLSISVADMLTEKQPKSADAWLNLAFTLDYFKDYKAALKATLKCLDNKPNPELMVKAGNLLSKFNQDKLAIKFAKQGYESSVNSIDLASGVLRVALKNCEWGLSEVIVKQLRNHYLVENYKPVETPRTHLLWCDDEILNISVLSKFASSNFPVRDSSYSAIKKDIHKDKIRVGFISYDFREHATSHLALGLLRHFNREQFEYFAYCTSWDDGSALRRDILNRFTKVRVVGSKNDKFISDLIHSDKIDILVDLNGLTEGTKMAVLAYKPAPIQIAYLGFPGTSGGRYIDYIFADDYTIPAGQENLFPEKIIRIPPTYQMNDYDAKWLPPKMMITKTNLPKNNIVIGMFNNANKITPLAWLTWMTILMRLPEAVLWILDPGEVARENLIKSAADHGVMLDRIIFAPKLKTEDHFARLQLCDFVLDPWPYGGHTTTSDALFCGVPVIALEGKNFASRVSGGLLIAAGLKKLIARDVDDYIQMAVDLATNKDDLNHIKQHLISNRKKLPIFKAKRRTQQIERAFLHIYNCYLKNQSKHSFRVV